MNYPFWEVPVLGSPMVIALIAIVHAFISHFAVGTGFFLPLTEQKAHKDNDASLLAYLKKHSRFFILVSLVGGAITGVAIWFTIGLISPQATSTLIRNFVWGWAIEWVFFIGEITSALLYVSTWDKVSRQTHVALGYIYGATAWLSLVIINGIITFMLTPGRWLETGGFWDGFFNPTYFPSLVMRTAISFALAGLYALITASFQPADLKKRLVKLAAVYIFPATLIIPLAGLWYAAMLPPQLRFMVTGGLPLATRFFRVSLILAPLLFLYVFFVIYRRPAKLNLVSALVALVLALAPFGGMEFVREIIRKPYVINQYLYSTQIFVRQADEVKKAGLLNTARWTVSAAVTDPMAKEAAAGADLYRLQCASCHTKSGYNGLLPLVRGWDEEIARTFLDNLDMNQAMPPFLGNETEREILAKWLVTLSKEAR